MKLRARIVLTLLAITAALAAPSAYGLLRLYDLRAIARDLRERDTQAAEARGQFETAVEALDRAQAGFAAFGGPTVDSDPESPARAQTARQWLDAARAAEEQGDRQLTFLVERQGEGEYRAAVDSLTVAWERLRNVAREERTRLEQGVADQGNTFRETAVLPALAAVDRSLTEVAAAVETESRAKVARAEEVAQTASTTALMALAVALAVTLALGFWLTRGLLRPIQELRKGMAAVSEGDLEPDVRVPADRPDEIGDLARSFRTMTEQLAELDRLKAEFVSVASHEIKTPLSIIRGYVSLLADGIYGPVSDAQRKTLKAVNDQTDRLTRLVHRLLDISRFEAGGGRLELREIDLGAFFDELTSGFQVLATQNGIHFPVTLSADLPRAFVGDPDRLNEVLGNLLSNAFKFTASGGTIRLDAWSVAGGMEIEVADTGVGIPPEKLPKIFEKFYQVENDAQPRSVGSGLGLAIAREIVEAHGGTITAESRVGAGTRFRVVLPERPEGARNA